MDIEDPIPLLEDVLGEWQLEIGSDFTRYRNHVYRVAHYCFTLHAADDDDRGKIMIAASFHDLGIWSAHTFDYLSPSIGLATDYLRRNGLEPWCGEIELMIETHHKLRAYPDPRHPLVEVFRKADLIDLSLGLVKHGLSSSDIAQVKRAFPNGGFHKRLVRLAGGWLVRHPLRPLPMLRW